MHKRARDISDSNNSSERTPNNANLLHFDCHKSVFGNTEIEVNLFVRRDVPIVFSRLAFDSIRRFQRSTRSKFRLINFEAIYIN